MNLEASMSHATIGNVGGTAGRKANKRIWTGRIISGLVVAFLLFDAICKILRLPMVLEASAKLGFGEGAVVGIGLLLLLCVIAYLVPRTAVLGAVLLTGYFGGAICTHVRNFEGAFPIVFVLIFATLTWLGLGLRDARVSAMVASHP